MSFLKTISQTKQYPLVPIRGSVLFPRVSLPLIIGRPKSVAAVKEAIKTPEKMVVCVTQKDARTEEPNPEQVFRFGTLGIVEQTSPLPGNGQKVVIRGLSRVEILDFKKTSNFWLVGVKTRAETIEAGLEIEALVKLIFNQVQKILELGRFVPPELLFEIFDNRNPGQVADTIAFALNLPFDFQQQILETMSTKERLRKVSQFLSRELEVMKVGREIEGEAHKELSKIQREVILREQLRAIQKELGGEAGEYPELEKKIKAAKMPKEVEDKALKELNRLMRMGSYAPEASYIRTYLDWMVEMPWSQESKETLDLKKAKAVLDKDHYGLDKVKERVLEFLAVKKMANNKYRGPILCFVGPPGTGKTSIGRSIAKALGRQFVRISLGGIRDEAEIRGHRRTYVGALPGRIIQGIHQSKTRNPVFMLDEIDKIGADFRGDPSSALLEALDPEQNFSFSDHYLEAPFDLSRVMFITTANILDTIPPALQDRLEVIEFPGYIEDEKLQIAQKFLLPKQIQENGLSDSRLEITREALQKIIRNYTREAGVRNLERELNSICRKVARALMEGKNGLPKVSVGNLVAYLDEPRFRHGLKEEKDEIGVATGLAWTEAGGDILFVESTVMKGKGNLVLTGRLGEVMKESGQAAFSYARSRAINFGIKEGFYQDTDIHVHVPAGAIPKDGPSAGVAIAASIISSLTKKPMQKEVGMTGEVTLRGKVLEVGGVKEKVLAAHRAGLKTVLLPLENKKDLKEVPSRVKRDLKFIFVKNMDEVLKYAMVN